jgi:hypothetical protein
MRALSTFRAGLVAVLALAGVTLQSAQADEGGITFTIVKAGFVVGGSGGSGTLFFHGAAYPLSIGGLSYGFTFGASETRFRGTVSHIRRPSDVSGVYAAGNVGAAVGAGAQAIVLTNEKGAILTLSGRSIGAIVSADLNGLILTVR